MFLSTVVTLFDVPDREAHGSSVQGPSSIDEVTLELPRGDWRGLDRGKLSALV